MIATRDSSARVIAGPAHDAPAADAYATNFGRALVFGPPERPLVGRLHAPEGPVRGAVVLCNPWGYEENCAFLAFQLLARQLAQRGFEVMRFDYDGCGNSWGDFADGDRLANWTSSCLAAIGFMSDRTGSAVRVVGLRMGAALAALASASHAIDRAVFWDPVVSGRRYLRALRAMSMMGVDAAPDPADPGSLVVIGNSLSSATVAEIDRLDLKALTRSRIAEALVIGRPGASDPQRLTDALRGLGVPAMLEEHPGTDALFGGAAEVAVIPVGIVDRIVAYIADRPLAAAPRHAPGPGSCTLVAPGGAWTEEHYTVTPPGLSAVLTLPRTLQRSGVVVMINNGISRSIGPARAWVEWSRAWAKLGIATLRFDLSGLGDSGTRPNQESSDHYPIEAIDDFALMIEDLRRRGLGPALAVGLCSGAFLSFDAAAASVNLAGIAAINSQLWYLPDLPGSPNRLRRAAPPTQPWLQRFLENTRVGRRLIREIPFAVWWLLDRLKLQPAPLRSADAVKAKTPVLLIYGEDNEGMQRLRQRDRSRLRRWCAAGDIIVMKGLDHSMFAPQVRAQVEVRVRRFMLEHLPAR